MSHAKSHLHLSEREEQLPPAIIGKLLKLAVESKNVISLGPGEPDFPAPQPIIEWTKQFADKCSHYSPPGGRAELKEAIIKKLARENRIYTHSGNIIVTSGSQEALLLALACAADVGEQILMPNPSYMAYLPTIEILDATPVFFDIKEKDNFEPDIGEIRKKIDPRKTKALIINSPANPTGNVISKKVLEEIADLAIEFDLYVFSDEAYERIIYGNAKHYSIGSFNGMEDHVVTFQTMSKTYAMCGYRLGYATGPKEIIDAMTKMHLYTTLSAPTISQMVATKALNDLPSKYVKEMVNEYDRRRKMIAKRLNGMGLPTPTPHGAFYTFSNISHYTKSNSFDFSKQILQKAKVAVMPGSEFGSNGDQYIRCSYATKYERIEEAMDRLERFLKK